MTVFAGVTVVCKCTRRCMDTTWQLLIRGATDRPCVACHSSAGCQYCPWLDNTHLLVWLWCLSSVQSHRDQQRDDETDEDMYSFIRAPTAPIREIIQCYVANRTFRCRKWYFRTKNNLFFVLKYHFSVKTNVLRSTSRYSLDLESRMQSESIHP